MKNQSISPTPGELAQRVKEFDEVVKRPFNLSTTKVPVSEIIDFVIENRDNLKVLKEILASLRY